VAVRNVARARRRGFGGLAFFAATLTLLAAGPAAAAQASSEAALSSSKTVLGLSLTRASSAKEALEIRGASVGADPTQYSAVTTLSRIPCPGAYQYDVQTENQQTGSLGSYAARITLAPLSSSQGASCGDAPPPRPGTLRISIAGDDDPIDFRHARGSASGGFFGDLTATTQPVCDERYTLSVDVDLRGWDRSVRYRFKVVSWESEAQGLPLESPGDC